METVLPARSKPRERCLVRRLPTVVVCGVVAALVAACSATSGGDGDTLTVFAAASLTDAFEELAASFEASHPDVDVVLNLAGSSTLREQILAGAPADVFASADVTNMDALVAAGAVGPPSVFATNRLRIAVPAGNPGSVTGLDDLADDGLLLGLCAPDVPCGALARTALAEAGVDASPDTEEPDVRALLTKLAAGELDVGLVYATDVVAAGDDVEGIDLPAAIGTRTEYPVAVVEEANRPEDAAAFVAFLLDADAQAVMRDHGFGAP